MDVTCMLFQIPEHMWCPTALEVNGKVTEYPLPEPYLPLNFPNSTGMRYEAEEVRQCLLKGTWNLRLWRWVYINTPLGGARDAGAGIDLILKASFLTVWLSYFRAEGEYNYESCWFSAAGRAGGWSPQAGGGGVQPGLPVNEEIPSFTVISQHLCAVI